MIRERDMLEAFFERNPNVKIFAAKCLVLVFGAGLTVGVVVGIIIGVTW